MKAKGDFITVDIEKGMQDGEVSYYKLQIFCRCDSTYFPYIFKFAINNYESKKHFVCSC